MCVTARLMDLGNVYLQRRGDPGGGIWGGGGGSLSTHLGSRITAAGWNSGAACLLSCGALQVQGKERMCSGPH